MNNNIKKIVLTGESCAGKTECLKPLREYFDKKGYSFYLVNEMATELTLGGINPEKIGGNLFQDITVKMQLELEDAYTLKIYDSSDSKNPIAEETIEENKYDSGYVSNKYYSKAKKYKHTFKKNDVGEYYWYSSEPYTE